ncbi:MAG: class I SAM-dependent methyltransferase [Bryobacteraceae bacterium]
MRVTAIEGHRNWAASYDVGPNPLLALETRLLLERLSPLRVSRFLDIACGTGRWMLLAQRAGSRVFGVDFCPEMLLEASRKPGLSGCLSLADACRIPVADGAADLTLCSFALGYLPSPQQAMAEMARASRKGGRVVVTDLHPDALASGWTRSFRSDGQVYEIDHHHHPTETWEAAGESSGLTLDWRLEACFGEPERAIFLQAGRASLFSELSRIPALLAMSWTKS